MKIIYHKARILGLLAALPKTVPLMVGQCFLYVNFIMQNNGTFLLEGKRPKYLFMKSTILLFRKETCDPGDRAN